MTNGEEQQVTTVTASRFRSEFTSAWLTAMESRNPLVVTANGRPDFVIFPIKAAVPMIHRMTVVDFATGVFSEVTGRVPEEHWADLPTTSPDTMRRGLGEERRRFRSLMRPFIMTYYGQIAAVLFPIPHDGNMETVGKFRRVWYGEEG